MVKFARATGDIHALSSADVRLIALAHGLEVAAHGGGHLHELPQMPTLPKKRVIDRKLVRPRSLFVRLIQLGKGLHGFPHAASEGVRRQEAGEAVDVDCLIGR